MTEFFQNPLFLLSLTLGLYFLFSSLQQKLKLIWLNAVLFTTASMISFLIFFNISYETYYKGGYFIEFWLKPSVVALGFPLYIQLEKIKKMIVPIIVSQVLGSVVGVFSVCYLADFLGAKDIIIWSIAPKSITTPLAIEVSENLGGISALTASMVVATGLFGMIFGFSILKFFKMKNPVAQSVALGTACHGLGIAAAGKISKNYSAYASIGLIFNGILTSIIAPYIVNLFFK